MKFTVICPVDGCLWETSGNDDAKMAIIMAWNDLEIHLRQVHDWRHSEIQALIRDDARMNKIVKAKAGVLDVLKRE